MNMNKTDDIKEKVQSALSQPTISQEVHSQLLAEMDESKKIDENLEKFCDYLERGFLSSTHPNGYKNWEYADKLATGEIDDTTNNCAEALNSQFNKFACSGVTSYAEMLKRTYEFYHDYTGRCAEKRNNNKMTKRSKKINQRIKERVKKIRSFKRLPESEQNKCFIHTLQIVRIKPIDNPRQASQSDNSDDSSASSTE